MALMTFTEQFWKNIFSTWPARLRHSCKPKQLCSKPSGKRAARQCNEIRFTNRSKFGTTRMHRLRKQNRNVPKSSIKTLPPPKICKACRSVVRRLQDRVSRVARIEACVQVVFRPWATEHKRSTGANPPGGIMASNTARRDGCDVDRF